MADDITVCAFNRRGNLLAGGCANGVVVVWDFDTHGVAQQLLGHTEKVTAVSWTRSSRRLLSSSSEGKLILWDVLTATATQTVVLDGEINHAALHPRRRALALACVSSGAAAGQAFLVDLGTGAAPTPQPLVLGGASEGVNATFACFSKEGDQTLVGTSKGAVHILDTATKAELKCVQLGGSSIKSLYLAKDGKSFLANSADHVIRARSLEKILAGEPDKPRELRDVVNRVQWAHASFTSDSEHVVGTANSATDHLLYIWDMHGHLTTILGQGEKVKDGALHFACHPTRPILAVCSRSGSVYIWTKKYSENWSAFAPDFKELEENEEYDERGDDFDIKPVRLASVICVSLAFRSDACIPFHPPIRAGGRP